MGWACAVKRVWLAAPALATVLTERANANLGGWLRVLLLLLPAGVEVLARYELTPEERAAQGHESVIVAVRSDHLMATAFHPELTSDVRWAGRAREGWPGRPPHGPLRCSSWSSL